MRLVRLNVIVLPTLYKCFLWTLSQRDAWARFYVLCSFLRSYLSIWLCNFKSVCLCVCVFYALPDGAAQVATCSCGLSVCWVLECCQVLPFAKVIKLGSGPESAWTMPPAHWQDSVFTGISTESKGSTAATYNRLDLITEDHSIAEIISQTWQL